MTDLLLTAAATSAFFTAWALLLTGWAAWLTERFPLGTITTVGGNGGGWAEDEDSRNWDRVIREEAR